MKKTTKGALAAAASASLLLGGAGSLAYWNTTDDVTAGTFTTGDLVLDATSCDTAGWTVTNTVEGVTDAAFDIATKKVVPGDTFTKKCTIDIVAVGENLRAALAVTGGAETESAGLDSDDATVTSTFLVGATEGTASQVTSITDADNGKKVFVTMTVAFPIGSAIDDDSKTETLALDSYTVTATQATS